MKDFMNIDLLKMTTIQFKKALEESITHEIKMPYLIYQRKHFKSIRNYLRNYAESNGLYFVELDEFTDIYIDKVVNLYKEMSDNDYCIIYLRMYDCIDYSQPHHQEALCKLYNALDRHNNNMQIVIDYHITEKEFDPMNDLRQPAKARCYTFEII